MLQILTVVALTLIAVGTAVAQVGIQSLQITNPAEIRTVTRLNERIDALSRQVMVCAEKKLAPPERCFCNYPRELAALQKEQQAVVRLHPSWTTRPVSWTESASGFPVSHTIAIAHLGPQLASCSAK